MNPTPTNIQNIEEPITIECNDETKAYRLSKCLSCDSMIIDVKETKCIANGCLINLMTTFEFKQCPKGYW